MTRREALSKAYRCFRRGQPLPVDLYMELRGHGYDPETLEAQFNHDIIEDEEE